MRPRDVATAACRLLVALVVEIAAVAALVHVSAERVADPPWRAGTDPWWRAQEPIDAAASIAGWVAILLIAYLAAVTALHLVALVARTVRPGRRAGRVLTAVAARIGPRWIASIAATATLAGLTATACSGPVAHVSAGSAAPDTPVTMVVEPTTTEPAPIPEPAPAPDPGPTLNVSPPHSTTRSGLVTVGRGDSFWSIAERVVAERAGRPVSASDVEPYWRILVEVNRTRLVDPTNPSRLYAGQQILVP